MRYEPVPMGGVLYLLPVADADDSPELRRALEVRMAATLSGRCPVCGARAVPSSPATPGMILTASMEHDPGCVAVDPTLEDVELPEVDDGLPY